MKITIDNKAVEVSGEKTLIEELRSLGYDVPSLCYDRDARHQASCMVCMVRNAANGQMMPSCSTYPVEGMQIEVDCEEVSNLRRISLELLLSDHRADCEAPCTVVCPQKLDVAKAILYYDRGQMAEAASLVASVFDVNNLPCNDCKAPCEKACRRGTLDKCVSIRSIIQEITSSVSVSPVRKADDGVNEEGTKRNVPPFSSKLGRYTDAEKEWLKEVYSQPSKCLHCACEGKSGCKLREYAGKAGIKSTRYGVSSHQLVKEQIYINDNIYFEPAKCVRCGLCVYNTKDGFTFMNRGFDMQVVIPEESRKNVTEDIARLCPTGAIFVAGK